MNRIMPVSPKDMSEADWKRNASERMAGGGVFQARSCSDTHEAG
jgi:hypothetical protein